MLMDGGHKILARTGRRSPFFFCAQRKKFRASFSVSLTPTFPTSLFFCKMKKNLGIFLSHSSLDREKNMRRCISPFVSLKKKNFFLYFLALKKELKEGHEWLDQYMDERVLGKIQKLPDKKNCRFDSNVCWGISDWSHHLPFTFCYLNIFFGMTSKVFLGIKTMSTLHFWNLLSLVNKSYLTSKQIIILFDNFFAVASINLVMIFATHTVRRPLWFHQTFYSVCQKKTQRLSK